MKDYAATANQYVADVLEGRRPGCKWERLACERHVRDLLGMPIVGGSSNMQKNNIASLLKL